MGLLNFDDSVNSGEYTRTYSHWVRYDCGLWLIAWDVEVHENEYYCSDSDTGWFSSLLQLCVSVRECVWIYEAIAEYM